MSSSQNTSAGSQIVEGLTVFDAAGEKVGTVGEQDAQGGYFVVQKAWLFPKAIYVPFTAVSRVDATGVYISVSKDAINAGQWDSPPDATTTATTMAADTTYDTRQTARTVNIDTATDGEDVRVPVMEEELVAGTREAEQGRVHLHKDVVEEQQTITVPVTREEVHVERVAASGDVAPGTDTFVERDIEVPLMGEEVVTSKHAHVVEEVRLHKDVATETKQVSDTVRKERVEVESSDATSSSIGDTTGSDSMSTRASRPSKQ